jgi:thiamine-phosphate pyrophosphorylase
MADKLARAKLARAARRLNAQSGHAGLPPLILMTDDARLPDPLAAAHALPRGSMVILRARDPARRAELARALRAVTRARGQKLLIANDGILASRIGADGIHLFEAAAKDAGHWRARHPGWIITAAAHAPGAALALRHVDAAIAGPLFPTQSHAGGGAWWGTLKFRSAVRQARCPVYALGGIDAASISRLDGARLAGIAAIGALIP